MTFGAAFALMCALLGTSAQAEIVQTTVSSNGQVTHRHIRAGRHFHHIKHKHHKHKKHVKVN
jgi:hypothetical protein